LAGPISWLGVMAMSQLSHESLWVAVFFVPAYERQFPLHAVCPYKAGKLDTVTAPVQGPQVFTVSGGMALRGTWIWLAPAKDGRSSPGAK
jgi:hypothetical protein